MLKEFKAFIMRGNVVDLAVAVIIGTAFTAIVNSLVTDIITPLLLNPTMDFLKVKNLEEIEWNHAKYGKLIAAAINFIIIAFILFIIVRVMHLAQRKKDAKEKATIPEPTKEEILLTEIRDLLKNRPL